MLEKVAKLPPYGPSKSLVLKQSRGSWPEMRRMKYPKQIKDWCVLTEDSGGGAGVFFQSMAMVREKSSELRYRSYSY